MDIHLWQFLLLYLLLVNLAGLILMGVDKRRARRERWRIPERRLFLPALLGGAAGCVLGMQLFRHKTKHWYFVLGMPALLLIHVGLVIWLLLFSPWAETVRQALLAPLG